MCHPFPKQNLCHERTPSVFKDIPEIFLYLFSNSLTLEQNTKQQQFNNKTNDNNNNNNMHLMISLKYNWELPDWWW